MRKTSANAMRVAAAAGLVLVGCGGSKPEVKEPEPEPVAQHEATGPKLAVAQELGSIDPGEVQKAWNRLQGDFDRCRKTGQERIEYIHGDMKFFIRVGQDGGVKWTYLEDSNLGDRDTEKCLLDVITRARWPKPEGGDAEIRNSLGFDADGRPPSPWSTDKIAALLGKNDRDLRKCKGRERATFHVTLYVTPNHKDGKVQAIGVSAPVKDASDAIECIIGEVKGWKLPSPGSWGAKVEFRI
jgi:hypothetical protein